MKLNGISLNAKDEVIDLNDVIGDEHISTSMDTPMRPDAFEMDEDLKIELIEKHFKEKLLL